MKLPSLSRASRFGFAWLLVAQFALFWQYARREIVWAYPAAFDQAGYLVTDYTLYREMLQNGLSATINRYLHELHATGIMLPLQDSILHFFLGPGRMSNLLLNLSYFLALETAFFLTARWVGGRTAFGWLGCGLLLLQQTVFLFGGGLFDCRIDSIAYSLYGIFVCAVVRSDAFREKRWLAAAFGAAMLMVSFRFITLTYLIGFCCTLFTAMVVLYWLWRGRRLRETLVLRRALRRTVVFGVCLVIGGGVLPAVNWKAIHGYYVVGHLTGGEKHIRAAEAGVSSLGGHLSFYLVSLLRDHLGATFVAAWLVVAAAGLLGFLFARRREKRVSARLSPLRSRWFVQLVIIGASLFSPWFILTTDESKSGIVANVLAVPATLLVISLVAGLRRAPARGGASSVAPTPAWEIVWRVLAGLVLMLGIGNWLSHLARQGPFAASRSSVQQIEALHEYLGEQSASRNFAAPALAADVVYDWSQAVTITASLFEHRGLWLPLHPVMGGSIFALSREQVFAALAQADIVLLSSFPKDGVYPFYDSIRPLAGEMTAWCEGNCLRGKTFTIEEHQVVVYFRRKLVIEGLSGEWVTPDGFRLLLPGGALDWMRASQKNFIVLEGGENSTWLPNPPTASAQAVDPSGAPVAAVCPAVFSRSAPGRYQIRVDVRALLALLPPGASPAIAIRLEHSYFVPVEVGAGSDTRHLVVAGPDVTRFE